MRQIGEGYKIVIQAGQTPDSPPLVIESFIPEEISLGYAAEYDQPFQTLASMINAIPSTVTGALAGRALGGAMGSALGGAAGFLSHNVGSSAAGYGSAPTAPIFTAKLWQSTSSPEITIPLYFEAESDPLQEIRKPIVDLLSLVIPSVNSLGILKSPASYLDFTKVVGSLKTQITAMTNIATSQGKGLLEAFAQNANIDTASITNAQELLNNAKSGVSSVVNAATAQASALLDASSASMSKKSSSSGTSSASATDSIKSAVGSQAMMQYLNKTISVRIGTYLVFPCVVIHNVTPTFTSQIDYNTGWPMSARVDITFSPMFTTVQDDLNVMFNSIPQQMSATASQGYVYNSLFGALGGVLTGVAGTAINGAIDTAGSFVKDKVSGTVSGIGESVTGWINDLGK